MTYPNILKVKDNCATKLCRFGSEGKKGDVRRCSHGLIWYCYKSAYGYWYLGQKQEGAHQFKYSALWTGLNWFRNPILFHRARRALNPPIASWNVI